MSYCPRYFNVVVKRVLGGSWVLEKKELNIKYINGENDITRGVSQV